jgi:hypothetical protein
MPDDDRPRFQSTDAVLRFYFRASELLHGYDLRSLPGKRSTGAADSLGDYLAIAGCLKGLNPLQFRVLRELYAPSCFGDPKRTLKRAARMLADELGNERYATRRLARLRDEALDSVGRALAVAGLSGKARSRPGRKRRPG